MKLLLTLIILSLVAACDPYHFGFKRNPAYVLYSAFQAVEQKDVDSFLSFSGKEALCLYGNDQGISYLQQNLQIDVKNVDWKNSKLNSRYQKTPIYAGFWVYYQERYQVNIVNKKTQEAIVDVVIDCNYGNSEEKNEKYNNQKPNNYKKRECQLIKITPHQFEGIPLPAKCDNLKVTL
jgi:hypothetical protein